MHSTIYFNDRPLFLCDRLDPEIEKFAQADDAVLIDELNNHTVKAMIHEMENPAVHAGVFVHPDLSKLEKEISKKFTIVEAAGGLVRNQEHAVLMIFRRGRWDLPKGKRDEGESIESCAVREVQEETGLKNVRLISPLCVTMHTYHEGTKFILKKSHWFSMSLDADGTLKPQTEEDITDIRWVPVTGLVPYQDQSFPLLRDIVNAAKKSGFISF